MANDGNVNELKMVLAINNKKVSKLNPNLRHLFETLYGELIPFKKVKAGLVEGRLKPDIWIEYRGKKKFISIKMGRSVYMHGESIKTFIPYLRSLNVSEETLKIFALYHWGDRTLDGSGVERFSTEEIYKMMRRQIAYANRELNSDPQRIRDFVDKMLFRGMDPTAPAAEYIYLGNEIAGTVVSREKVLLSLNLKNYAGCDYYGLLHIGPLAIRPHARYPHREIHRLESRERVYVEWRGIDKDVPRIVSRLGF